MVINGVMRELEKEKEIVVCPPIWYGVASYAVGGPETGTIQVDEDAYTNYLYCILKSMIYGGVKNIYCVAHHQTEEAGLMPMTIACHKAAAGGAATPMPITMKTSAPATIRSRTSRSFRSSAKTRSTSAAASTTQASGKRPS